MATAAVLGDYLTFHSRHRYRIRRAVLALRLVDRSLIRSRSFRSVPDISLLRSRRFQTAARRISLNQCRFDIVSQTRFVIESSILQDETNTSRHWHSRASLDDTRAGRALEGLHGMRRRRGFRVHAVLLGKPHRVGAIHPANGFSVSARRRAGESVAAPPLKCD
jgi:hypothetical protein